MKINKKLMLGFLAIALLAGIVGYFTIYISEVALQKSIGENSALLAHEILDKIDRTIYMRAEEIMIYFDDLILKEIISNHEFDNIENIQQYIEEKDEEWIATEKDEITPFMQEILNRKISQNLRAVIKSNKERYSYDIFGEIFLTNEYGANIAQSGKTSD